MPWGKFWRLMHQLSGSNETFLARAQAADEDLAAVVAEELADDETPWSPPAVDWTLMHELQTQTRDRLGEIAALLADLPVAVKQRHTPPPTLARPQTALTRAMDRVKREREDAYDAKLDAFVSAAKQRWHEKKAREQEADDGSQ